MCSSILNAVIIDLKNLRIDWFNTRINIPLQHIFIECNIHIYCKVVYQITWPYINRLFTVVWIIVPYFKSIDQGVEKTSSTFITCHFCYILKHVLHTPHHIRSREIKYTRQITVSNTRPYTPSIYTFLQTS